MMCRDGRIAEINLCLIDQLISSPLLAAPLRRACVVLEQREELLRVQEFDSRLFQTASQPQRAACECCSGHKLYGLYFRTIGAAAGGGKEEHDDKHTLSPSLTLFKSHKEQYKAQGVVLTIIISIIVSYAAFLKGGTGAFTLKLNQHYTEK